MIITIKNRFILSWLWGPRDHYPPYATCSHKLALIWVKTGTVEWFKYMFNRKG